MAGEHPRRLDREASPYLRSHRDDPVHWFPWGEDAVDEARTRDVPILLSIGYSSCHWCHVMGRGAFGDPVVAEALNENFVNVLVDREERPDIDSIYMDAVVALTGRGGWPLTAIIDHDRRPLWAGGYLDPPAMTRLIGVVLDAWRDRRPELLANGVSVTEAIAGSDSLEPVSGFPDPSLIESTLTRLGAAFDRVDGGFGSAPKFPSVPHLELVMRAYMATGSTGAAEVITTTLDAMAAGGLNDHVDGGFARYSTDTRWLVPHFEKMLTDQAQMIGAYRRGWSLFGRHTYAQVVADTVSYVLDRLRHPAGGLMSSEDADSVGPDGEFGEGWFQTWTPAELSAVLGPAAEAVAGFYGIGGEPHVQGRWIPNRLHSRDDLGRPAPIERARHALRQARDARGRPTVDESVITEWNAAFVTALADAGTVMGVRDWVDTAVEVAEFLWAELRDGNGRWCRAWNPDTGPRGRALAGDHAALVAMCVQLATSTGRSRWTDRAVAVADTMLDRFWDPVNGGLFTSEEDDDSLIVRRKDLRDDSAPSANALAAEALHRLAGLTGESRYANHADRILSLVAAVAAASPTTVSSALCALDLRLRGLTEVVIPGESPELVGVAQRLWRPDVLVIWGEPTPHPVWEGRQPGRAYVCHGRSCDPPIDDPLALEARLRDGPTPTP
jgi:uncharacterized protein YyaL (SSP411 family)